MKIFGDDPRLDELAERWSTLLEAVPGVVDLVGLQAGSPEVDWQSIRSPPGALADRPESPARSAPRWLGVSAPLR